MKEIILNIITPEKKFFSGTIIKLITEDKEGSLGILPGHMSMVKSLLPHICTFKTKEEKEMKAFISSGILKIDKGSIDILCDSAEWPEDIDVNRAKKAQERAEERIKTMPEGTDIKRAELALKRALIRTKIRNI